MHKDCLHEVFHSTVLAKLYYMQAQLGRVSALQAKSTNSTDSSTDASLTTTATRQLHMFLNYLMWQIKKKKKSSTRTIIDSDSSADGREEKNVKENDDDDEADTDGMKQEVDSKDR